MGSPFEVIVPPLAGRMVVPVPKRLSGWQKVAFATPVQILADTTYVAGYHAPNGRYSVTGAAFSGGGVTNSPLTALANAVSANGLYRYTTAPAFPANTFNSANYWVDVMFEASP